MKNRLVLKFSLLALIIILSREGEVRAQKITERLAQKAILDKLKDGGVTISPTLTAPVNQHHTVIRRRAQRRTFSSLVRAAAARHQVNARLLWTVAYLETRSHFAAKHKRQLTARKIDGMAAHLRQLTLRFDEQPELVLASFHAGEETVAAYLEGRSVQLNSGQVINGRQLKTTVPPYRPTQKYVARGLHLFARLTERNLFSGPEACNRPRTVVVRPEESTETTSTILTATRQRVVQPVAAPELFAEEDLFFDPHSGECFIVGTSAEVQTSGEATMSAALEAPQRRVFPEDAGLPVRTMAGYSTTRVRKVYGNAFGN